MDSTNVLETNVSSAFNF